MAAALKPLSPASPHFTQLDMGERTCLSLIGKERQREITSIITIVAGPYLFHSTTTKEGQ